MRVKKMCDNNLSENSSNLEAMIRKNFVKAFEDRMEAGFKDGDWSYLILLLDEIQQRMCGLIPNRHDLHAKIKEDIPLALIKQMIDNEAIRIDDLRGYFTVLLEWVKKLGAPSEDSIADEAIVHIQQVTITSFATVIPPFIMKINELLDIIDQRKREFINELKSKTAS